MERGTWVKGSRIHITVGEILPRTRDCTVDRGGGASDKGPSDSSMIDRLCFKKSYLEDGVGRDDGFRIATRDGDQISYRRAAPDLVAQS